MMLDIAAMISHLKIGDISYENAIRHIFVLSKDKNLPLYFNKFNKLHGAKVIDAQIIHEDNTNEEGYSEEWAGCEYVEEFIGILKLPHLKVNNDLKWAIRHFYIGDDQYYITDDTGNQLTLVEVTDEDIYCKKEDLLASCESFKFKSDLIVSPNVSKKPQKKPERQEQAFKDWLIKESGLPIASDDDFYQRCYTTIGEQRNHKPYTRVEVWNALASSYPKLFRPNQLTKTIENQNFFNRRKGGQTIVSFEGNEG